MDLYRRIFDEGAVLHSISFDKLPTFSDGIFSTQMLFFLRLPFSCRPNVHSQRGLKGTICRHYDAFPLVRRPARLWGGLSTHIAAQTNDGSSTEFDEIQKRVFEAKV